MWNVSLSTLPTELHSIISEYVAQTDSGASISAFSCLSRYYRKVSLPYLYRNIRICVDDSCQRESLLAHYFHFHVISTVIAPRKMDVRNVLVQVKQPCRSDREASVILLLLLATSRTLETLYLDFPVTCSTNEPLPRNDPLVAVIAHLLHHTFPRLRNLTVKGFFHIFQEDILGRRPLEGYPTSPRKERFPSLSTLHVIHTWSTAPLFMMGAMEDAFPNVTHVHFSGVKPDDPIAVALHDGLKRRKGEAMLSGLVSFPARLKEVTVQYGTAVGNSPGGFQSDDEDDGAADEADELQIELKLLMESVCSLAKESSDLPEIMIRRGTLYGSSQLEMDWTEEACGRPPKLHY